MLTEICHWNDALYALCSDIFKNLSTVERAKKKKNPNGKHCLSLVDGESQIDKRVR